MNTVNISYKTQKFIEAHMPIVYDNPTYVWIVLGMSLSMLLLYQVTRHKAALVVAASALLYFVPFVRF
jgi:hypothetical protein